ncbi:PhoX family protein [Pelagibacteraceae bacterium]|jgi:uncharacterized protein|nr:PhoX family protein [Pelagibacteraceae bacterium]
MKNNSKRNFLKTASSVGLFLATSNISIWSPNNFAYSSSLPLSVNLQNKDKNDLMLPDGFTSRIIATTGKISSYNSSYKWHKYPDGGAVFSTKKNGWIYVSNSEVGNKKGGVGVIEFNKNADIINSYSICSKTSMNCAGGSTPWNTWLTCEETINGFVWECDPFGKKKQKRYKSLGKFIHEAAVVDPNSFYVYLTEDHKKGGFYRFKADSVSKDKADLSAGILQVAKINDNKKVTWINVPNPLAKSIKENDTSQALMKREKNKKIKYTIFNRGEGAWFHNDKVFFATTGDNSIWTYNTKKEKFKKIYKGGKVLSDPDNVTVSKNGLILAAEDSGNMEIVAISQKTNRVFPLVRIIGHDGSEITGPAFDPSGTRLYFSSQRGRKKKIGHKGITYEVSGPFEKYI